MVAGSDVSDVESRCIFSVYLKVDLVIYLKFIVISFIVKHNTYI